MQTKSQVLADLYASYLNCLNRQAWEELDQFVAQDVFHNGRALGLSGYRQMLEADFQAIPDLHFDAQLVAITPPVLACRLVFDCTPHGTLFDLPVHGRRIKFDEHVFYHFENGRIHEVWSIIDLAAIARQLAETVTH